MIEILVGNHYIRHFTRHLVCGSIYGSSLPALLLLQTAGSENVTSFKISRLYLLSIVKPCNQKESCDEQQSHAVSCHYKTKRAESRSAQCAMACLCHMTPHVGGRVFKQSIHAKISLSMRVLDKTDAYALLYGW